MTSKQLSREYRVLNFWLSKITTAVYRTKHLKTEQDKPTQYEISQKLYEIEELLKGLFGPAIGDAVMKEIRKSQP